MRRCASGGHQAQPLIEARLGLTFSFDLLGQP